MIISDLETVSKMAAYQTKILTIEWGTPPTMTQELHTTVNLIARFVLLIRIVPSQTTIRPGHPVNSTLMVAHRGRRIILNLLPGPTITRPMLAGRLIQQM